MPVFFLFDQLFKIPLFVGTFRYYLTENVLPLMYLGTIYIHTKFWHDRTSNMGARQLAAILENKLSAITPDLMAGLSPNFSHKYIVASSIKGYMT
jgi:hypothetical protein